MYQATVHRIKRGIFGPRRIKIYDEIGPYPEPLLAEISKYDDDWHYIVFYDFTQMYGDHDDRPEPGPTAWDAQTGEPTTDDRDRANYGRGAHDIYAEMDPSLPF